MALPLDNRQINTLVASTLDAARSEIIDNFFVSNGLFTRLVGKEKVRVEGGEEIRSHFIYGGVPAGPYGEGQPFGSAVPEFITDLRLDWKMNRAELAMHNLSQAKNRGAYRIFDHVAAMKQTAQMSLSDTVGKQLYTNAADPLAIDGLKSAINDTGTYGGVTRGATGPGAAIKSYVNTTGGPFSFTMVKNAMGRATIGKSKPDLIVTTQTIFDKMWAQSQPSERNVAEDLREVGFDSIRISSADVLVDNNCPDGEIFILNTDFVEFWCMSGNEFRLRGPFDLHLQDSWVAQYILYANLLVKSPRLCARIENVS